MSQQDRRTEIARKGVVHQIPGIDAVTVQRDIVYGIGDSGFHTLDLYCPCDLQAGARKPAVVFVVGYSDLWADDRLGCKFKEMESYVSWAKLTAASGLVAVTYANREPATDIGHLLQYLRTNAATLGIESERIGLWACSGNVPLALSALLEKGNEFLRCAVLCYGYMLDLDGSTNVSEASRTWGFANPCTGKTVDDLPPQVPLLIARAGMDQTANLNQTIDAFIPKALHRNLPICLVNHATAPHAFDLFHDSDTSREIIGQILEFMRFHLR
jgi:hypothetical protein